ncbi:hypothetical protein TMEN_2627 [Trichophyton mentagrophytes]|uniref:T6SS Phospholipase effector Tle1-like catalytic domain-containing protein n=1 Tax=Trichophyton interdigitale (strain MR816) TaxID=1215338 RepID=A0A059J3U1_TRIIM|nr:hypothetical protein H101_04818 [Trichophyton interdigitale H6]KDB22333.1 hypothetical protein H109_05757 [Trichophyton interdigitale MR816]GBF60218.1 hypothetical protein TMEN_2627 [Trichophyton mentagrophytes]
MATVDEATETPEIKKPGRRLVLCFDGTGNHFKGNESDSNVVKLYQMLDRHDKRQFHYYQPGIGTFNVNMSNSITIFGRMRSKISEIIDKAIGTSFEYHVSSGYRFLMRYYKPGDDIYIFGFSRGAYTARFLAEMIEHVGLLSMGNEDMIRFVYGAFSKWQTIRGKTNKTPKDIEVEDYLQKLKVTFCRKEVGVFFLGLFDCVNSVSTLEIPFSHREYRYCAPSPAKHVRHALSIHERRLKFKPALFTFESEDKEASVKEVWFAGNHSDVGGGFAYENNARFLLSDIPLAWMLEEALSVTDAPAGPLTFDDQHPEALNRLKTIEAILENEGEPRVAGASGVVPEAEVSHFRHHDSLVIGRGAEWHMTIIWWFMELLPIFTRLELEDHQWKPRYWPPNCGAHRDIPTEATLHCTVEKMHKAGILKKMPKLGGDKAPLLNDPLIVPRYVGKLLTFWR